MPAACSITTAIAQDIANHAAALAIANQAAASHAAASRASAEAPRGSSDALAIRRPGSGPHSIVPVRREVLEGANDALERACQATLHAAKIFANGAVAFEQESKNIREASRIIKKLLEE